MAKTQEELNELKEEVETISKRLAELAEEELEQVVGGIQIKRTGECPICHQTVEITIGIFNNKKTGSCGHSWK